MFLSNIIGTLIGSIGGKNTENNIVINNKKFTGKSVKESSDGRILIDDKPIILDGDDPKQKYKIVTIVIHGNVDGKVTTATGDITINGNAGDIKSNTGNITIQGNVSGDVTTTTGDVDAGTINGDATTTVGTITNHGKRSKKPKINDD